MSLDADRLTQHPEHFDCSTPLSAVAVIFGSGATDAHWEVADAACSEGRRMTLRRHICPKPALRARSSGAPLPLLPAASLPPAPMLPAASVPRPSLAMPPWPSPQGADASRGGGAASAALLLDRKKAVPRRVLRLLARVSSAASALATSAAGSRWGLSVTAEGAFALVSSMSQTTSQQAVCQSSGTCKQSQFKLVPDERRASSKTLDMSTPHEHLRGRAWSAAAAGPAAGARWGPRHWSRPTR
jgi:hypothetical protein